MKTEIRTRQEMLDLRSKLGVRMDWHEPTEAGVTVATGGVIFDNAGFDNERRVVLFHDGDEYTINLACLLSWASGGEA